MLKPLLMEVALTERRLLVIYDEWEEKDESALSSAIKRLLVRLPEESRRKRTFVKWRLLWKEMKMWSWPSLHPVRDRHRITKSFPTLHLIDSNWLTRSQSMSDIRRKEGIPSIRNYDSALVDPLLTPSTQGEYISSVSTRGKTRTYHSKSTFFWRIALSRLELVSLACLCRWGCK